MSVRSVSESGRWCIVHWYVCAWSKALSSSNAVSHSADRYSPWYGSVFLGGSTPKANPSSTAVNTMVASSHRDRGMSEPPRNRTATVARRRRPSTDRRAPWPSRDPAAATRWGPVGGRAGDASPGRSTRRARTRQGRRGSRAVWAWRLLSSARPALGGGQDAVQAARGRRPAPAPLVGGDPLSGCDGPQVGQPCRHSEGDQQSAGHRVTSSSGRSWGACVDSRVRG